MQLQLEQANSNQPRILHLLLICGFVYRALAPAAIFALHLSIRDIIMTTRFARFKEVNGMQIGGLS